MDPTPDPLLEALELARRSALAGGGPFGAVVVRDGRVIGRGHNRVTLDGDPTAHAEVVALREAARTLRSHDLSGSVLYSSCEPCPMCRGAILWARVARVEFAADRHAAAAAGFDDAAFYAEFEAPPGAGRVPFVQRLAARGEQPFEAWRENSGRRPY